MKKTTTASIFICLKNLRKKNKTEWNGMVRETTNTCGWKIEIS
jgi:hypothetical protein